MLLRTLLLLGLTVALASLAGGAEHFDGRSWWKTVRALADDRFEGRNTGSKGEREAQLYVAAQLKELGLKSAR